MKRITLTILFFLLFLSPVLARVTTEVTETTKEFRGRLMSVAVAIYERSPKSRKTLDKHELSVLRYLLLRPSSYQEKLPPQDDTLFVPDERILILGGRARPDMIIEIVSRAKLMRYVYPDSERKGKILHYGPMAMELENLKARVFGE